MHHILSIPAIIPQLIHHYFIRREIRCILFFLPTVLLFLNKIIYCKQQRRLANLVTVSTIRHVPDWTYCKNNLFVRECGHYHMEHFLRLRDTKESSLKIFCEKLMTICHYHSGSSGR